MKFVLTENGFSPEKVCLLVLKPECWSDRVILGLLKDKALKIGADFFDFSGDWDDDNLPGTTFKLVKNT